MSLNTKAGAVMKGLNIFAGKADPIIKHDAAYPSWLFDLLKDKPMSSQDLAPEQLLSVKYLRIQNRERIKTVALSKK
ncbi:hypothetical protein HDU81_002291 [Chytriomyces hyalinus]|nr:hypothetical protein HDU81_002291 [Chytriomyces hyalinus]